MGLDRLRNLVHWKWPFLIFLFGMIALYTQYVPYVRRQRGIQEERIAQDVVDDRRAPLLRTEAMWREYAEKAKVRGDVDDADKFTRLADKVRDTYTN